MGMTLTMRTFPQVKYRIIRKHYFYPTYSCTDETEDDDLATAGNTIINIAHNTYIKPTKPKLDSCEDGLDDGAGNSPLIVEVEDAIASIPADILDPASAQAPTGTVAGPESESAPTLVSSETAESSVVSL